MLYMSLQRFPHLRVVSLANNRYFMGQTVQFVIAAHRNAQMRPAFQWMHRHNDQIPELLEPHLVPRFLIQVHAVIQRNSLHQLHGQHPVTRQLIDHLRDFKELVSFQQRPGNETRDRKSIKENSFLHWFLDVFISCDRECSCLHVDAASSDEADVLRPVLYILSLKQE